MGIVPFWYIFHIFFNICKFKPLILLFKMDPIFSFIFCTVGRYSFLMASGANLNIPCEDHVMSLSPWRFTAVSMPVNYKYIAEN